MVKNILSIIFLFISYTLVAQQTEANHRAMTYKVKELINVLDKKYVEEVDAEKLKLDFIKGTQNRLVPFKSYIPTGLVADVNSDLAGLGLSIKFKADTIVVEEVLAGSGAELAGVKKGDKIVGIDTVDMEKVNYFSDLVPMLVGKEGTKVLLKLADTTDTSKVIEKEVIRKKVKGITFYNLGKTVTDIEKAIAINDNVYPDSVSNLEITETGIRYMLEQLDPHTAYISLEEIEDMNAPLKGSFTGVGVRFQIVKDTIVVVEAIPGGPSEKVGIQPGDKYIYVDDEKVAGIGIKNSGVRERLLGDKGTKVVVQMLRRGEPELLEFTIERDKIPIYSVDAAYMVDDKIGYIKLNKFSATTVAEVKQAVLDLKSKGMTDLILDLQGNGGGYLRAAIGLTDELLDDDKLVVYTEGRAFPKRKYGTVRKGVKENGRLIILVNENSASASEIVSGAIQDWDRGLIVGRRTFGKGLVQKPFNMSDGTQVRVTTSHYYTPTGRCIQKPYDKGIQEYRREKYNRYKNGEYFHKDSIHFDEKLKVYTIKKNRPVYGGGGIMPDVFVPLDTLGTSDYFSSLIRKGILNRFALTWVNDNRSKLQEKYVNFDRFNEKFNVDKLTKELIKYAEKEGLEFDEEGYKAAENTIKIRLKAAVAQNLFDFSKFYQINNELNTPLQEAIKIMKDGKAFELIE